MCVCVRVHTSVLEYLTEITQQLSFQDFPSLRGQSTVVQTFLEDSYTVRVLLTSQQTSTNQQLTPSQQLKVREVGVAMRGRPHVRWTL